MHISPECLEVLTEGLTINNNSITINTRLSETLFSEVRTVLTNIGGQYRTGARKFIFPTSPEELLNLVRITGKVPEKHHLNFYPTPEKVVSTVISELKEELRWLNPEVATALEPSAGRGALATPLRDLGFTVTCVEFNPINSMVLKKQGHRVIEGDFLQQHFAKPFDVIVMNPPFNLPERPDTYIDHVMHAHHHLTADGTLLAIVPPSYLHKSNPKTLQFQKFLERYERHHTLLHKGSFRESGTSIETVLLNLSGRPYQTTEIEGFSSMKTFHVWLTLVNTQRTHQALQRILQDPHETQPHTPENQFITLLQEIQHSINHQTGGYHIFLTETDIKELHHHACTHWECGPQLHWKAANQTPEQHHQSGNPAPTHTKTPLGTHNQVASANWWLHTLESACSKEDFMGL